MSISRYFDEFLADSAVLCILGDSTLFPVDSVQVEVSPYPNMGIAWYFLKATTPACVDHWAYSILCSGGRRACVFVYTKFQTRYVYLVAQPLSFCSLH